MTTSDDNKISEDRREALRYALAIGSGAALASALASPASAQTAADNTLDRIRANKVLRIAVLPGELPYFNKDLATGTWSGFSIEMANDIAKLLDVQLEYTEFTYGNSILDLQSNKIDLGFALNPTPSARWWSISPLRVPASVRRHAGKGLEAKTWGDINKPEVNRGRRRLRQRGRGAALRAERHDQLAEVARRGHAARCHRAGSIASSMRWCWG